MAYQVIARKWRPQTFEDVVFQEHVLKTLQNSITGKRISHAYLFSGPRGVGKTTVARILAKALNCQEGPTATPCGVCENCVEITRGTSFDVIEIDGASNNGIDSIRELRENVNFAPAKSTYKVYIIDEVHMVTTAAFNALLKTLEEPPPHVVFVFATTEYHKIPETIQSRCQKFFFKKIPLDAIVSHLQHVAETEGFSISDSAVHLIARAADGAMRDAQSLLEQVISFSANDKASVEIGLTEALTILGIVPYDSYAELLRGIAEGNALVLFSEVERVVDMGVDVSRYASGLSDCLRAIRLIKNGISLKNLLGLSAEESNMLTEISKLYVDEDISRMFHAVTQLENDLRYSSNERVNLEMTLLDMLHLKKNPSLSSIIKKIQEGAATSQPSAEPVSFNESRTAPVADISTPTPAVKEKEKTTEPEKKQTVKEPVTQKAEPSVKSGTGPGATIEKIKDVFYGEIIEKGE